MPHWLLVYHPRPGTDGCLHSLRTILKIKKYNDWEHLMPMDCLNNPKLIIGYNVSYDRARVLDEYNIKQSKGFFLDGMALHVAISGICSQQRPTWQKHKKSKSQLDSTKDESPAIESDIDYFDKKALSR